MHINLLKFVFRPLVWTVLLGISLWAFASTKTPIQKMEPNTKPKIIYVYDALCGWCFGFSPVINAFKKNHAEMLDFEIISGGLRHEDIGTINEKAPYIKTAYKDVEEYCGVKFGDAFVNHTLAKGDAILNSIPPARALCVFKKRIPEKAFEYASALHNAIYVDGAWSTDIEAFAVKAAQLGYPKDDFLKAINDPQSTKDAFLEFDKAKKLGATSFPTVLLQKGEKFILIGQGYMPADTLEARVNRAL
jgi:putative protein-disulfide isomerase